MSMETFRFSPRHNRAHEIDWRSWSPDAFEEARALDRPMLLNLTAVWCHWCHRMDETTYSDPELIGLINESLIPMRVDADRLPHVQDRYVAGGWPTNAFLTPTGEVLWVGTYVPPDELRAVAEAVLNAWRGKREDLQREVDRRRKAMEAARAQQRSVGLVRREAADDVAAAIQDSYDPRNGGFGAAPRFPSVETIEFLFVQALRTGDDGWSIMAERTLDGISAGELWDEPEGGYFRYALEEDWTSPQREKLLATNASCLRIFALGARLRDRDDWRRNAERTVAWVESTLGQPNGLWSASQQADEEYFDLDHVGRSARVAPAVDPVLYTDVNAAWIRAVAEAGGRLARPDWIERASTALDLLLTRTDPATGLLFHYEERDRSPALPGLLSDVLETAHACLAVSEAAGRPDLLRRASRFAEAMEQRLWAGQGGLIDHLPEPRALGALRYQERPFGGNASAARLFLDLAQATGERSFRGVAERILALLSPLAGRYGVAGAEFALAVEEFFDPSIRIVLVGPPAESAALRAAALSLAEPACRVWTMPEGGRIGAVQFLPRDQPVAYACGLRGCSPPITDPARLAGAVAAVR